MIGFLARVIQNLSPSPGVEQPVRPSDERPQSAHNNRL